MPGSSGTPGSLYFEQIKVQNRKPISSYSYLSNEQSSRCGGGFYYCIHPLTNLVWRIGIQSLKPDIQLLFLLFFQNNVNKPLSL
jgi:hypothetical protein